MTRPLRVVMPVLTYVPGAMGGSETYVRALVKGLQERDDVDLTVIASRAGAGGLGAESEHVVTSVRGGASTSARLMGMGRGFAGDPVSRRLMREADVIHYPFTVPVPRPPASTPWVVSLLDVQHRDLPQMFSSAERWYRAIAYDRAALRATRVVTISNFCRERITAALDIPGERVDVAHLGVDLARFHQSDAPREPFVFYPATAWPHKNHARLIAAMRLVRETRPDLRLVLTGGQREALGELPAWVEHRGVISDDEIAQLYRTAACLAFPSLYEGFGLPVLEAMASLCRVASSRAGALPEVCGEAAVGFDERDVGSIVAGIQQALVGSAELGARGSARAAAFTWDACASAHVDSYKIAEAVPHR